ncbi:MAG TPA: hypothetical protein VFA27_02950 [Vicinamibacterales bacterium]|nr:hypothetical protein [Vicinamibacterales bacterium]
MSRLRELLQSRPVSVSERLLLCARPTLDLSLALKRIIATIEFLAVNERDGPAL